MKSKITALVKYLTARRITASLLALAVMITSINWPDNVINAVADSRRHDGNTVIAFSNLDEGIALQKLIFEEQSFEDIVLPDSIEATIEYVHKVESTEAVIKEEVTGDEGVPDEEVTPEEVISEEEPTASEEAIAEETISTDEPVSEEESGVEAAPTEENLPLEETEPAEETPVEETAPAEEPAEVASISDSIKSVVASFADTFKPLTAYAAELEDEPEEELPVEEPVVEEPVTEVLPTPEVDVLQTAEFVTEYITENIPVSWKLDKQASSKNEFDDREIGDVFVFRAEVESEYDVEADLPTITVWIVEKQYEFNLSLETDGVKIAIFADEGVFPEGAYFTAERVSDIVEESVSEMIDLFREDGKNVAASYTFDITVYDKDGNVVEPDNEKGSVKVSFEMAEISNVNLDTDVYHVIETDEGLLVDPLDTIEETPSEVTVETDGFSFYTVEFTYGDLTYVLPGMGRVLISSFLSGVGLSGKLESIDDITISNTELFNVIEEDGEIYVKALNPFSTKEWMKIILDGVEYTVEVTDSSQDIFYVKDTGSDSNDGTVSKPFATIKKAYDSIASEGTIALLSDISLSGTTMYVRMNTGKKITITSAHSDGSLLENEAGNYDGVHVINRGSNTASFFDIDSGSLTLKHVILDGGSKQFAISDSQNYGRRSGHFVHMPGGSGACTFTMDTNSVLRNNDATGTHYGLSGGANGGAVVVSYEDGYYDCKFYMKSNARITGNITGRHGSAVTLYGSHGFMYMNDDALIDNNGILYRPTYADRYFGGGAILVYGSGGRGSTLYISDNSMITNNYVDMSNTAFPYSTSACAVQTNNTSKIYMSGNARIFDNFCLNTQGVADNTQANLYDATNNGGSVYINGTLGETAKLGVTAKSEQTGSIVASGSGYNLSDSDASHFFYDRNTYGIERKDNNLVLGAVSTISITSTETADCSSIKVELSEALDIVKNDVTLFFDGKKVDSGDYSVSTSDKLVTISFASNVKLPNGATIGVQISKNGYSINGGAVKDTKMTGHSLSYVADPLDHSRMTVTCTRENCYYHSHAGSISISAADSKYSAGKAYNQAKLNTEDCPIVLSGGSFEYYLGNGTTPTDAANSAAAGNKKAPVNAGEYVVKTTLGDVTISAPFSISAYGTLTYVSATGNDDTGNGTVSNPYKTLDKAYKTIASEGTIALLSDLNLEGSTAALYIADGKNITIISVDSYGKVLTNAEGDYNGVHIINRGANTANILELEKGSLTIENVIVDGGSKEFNMTGFSSKNTSRSGMLVYMQGTSGSSVFTMGRNSVLRNNYATGNHNGGMGSAVGGATVISHDNNTLYSCDFYMKSNARITGSIAPRHGGASTIYQNGSMYLSDNAVIDNNGIVYGPGSYHGGGALCVWGGSLYLSGNSMITKNYVDMKGTSFGPGYSACAIQTKDTTKIYLQDGARIFDNFCLNTVGIPDNTQSNLFDNTNSGIYIIGNLSDSAKIGVTANREYLGAIVARGSGCTLVEEDAAHFFYDRNNYGITLDSRNNVLKLGGYEDVIVTSEETADCSSVQVTLDKEINVEHNDVTLFFDGKKVEPSRYNVETSGKVVTITFPDEAVPNGAKVGVQINKNGYSVNGGEVKETEMTGHDLVFENVPSEPSKITVSCSREACYYHNHPGTITLVADNEYHPTAMAYISASVETTENCPVIFNNPPFEYYLSDSTTPTTKANCGAAGSKKAPANPGEYVVKLPLDGAQAEASFKITGPHVHGNWQYSASGNKLYAKCSQDEYKTTLTISAADAGYSGMINKASITADEDFPILLGAEDIVYYVQNDGTEKLTTKTQNKAAGNGKAPIMPGHYVAKVSIGEATAKVSFTIGKIDQTILPPTALTKNIKANEVTLIAVPNGHGATSYAVDVVNVPPIDESKWQSGTYFGNLAAGTKYYFFARYAGDEMYNEAVSEGSEITTLEKEEGGPIIGGDPVPGPFPGDPSDPEGPGVPEIPYEEDPDDPVPTIIYPKPDLPTPHSGDVRITYIYEGRDGTEYGPSLVMPTEVGKYWLIITVEDDVKQATKRVPFRIGKKEIPGGTDGEPSEPEPEEFPGPDDDPTIPPIPYGDPIVPHPTIFHTPTEPEEPTFPEPYEPTGTVTRTYTYVGRDGTTYPDDGIPTTTPPTKVGKYYLIVTVEDDISKAVERFPFEIRKKVFDMEPPVVPTDDDPEGPEVPTEYEPVPDIFLDNPSPQPGVPTGYEPDGEVVTSYTYVGRDGTIYPDNGIPTTVKPTAAGKYYLIIRVEDNIHAYVQKIPFVIKKEESGEPKGPTVQEPSPKTEPSGGDWKPDPDLYTGDPEFPDGYTPTGTIVKNWYYEGREETVYGPSKDKPVKAGKYYFVLTIEDDVKVFRKKIPFVLEKRNGGTITDVTPKEDPKFPYNPTGNPPFDNPNPGIFTGTPEFPEDDPVVGTMVTTYTYEGREGTYYGPSSEKPTEIGKYYLIIRIEDDTKYAEKRIPFEITKRTGEITATPKEPGTITAEPDGGDPGYEPVPDIITVPPTLNEPTLGDPTITYTYEGRDGTIYPDNGIPTTVKPTKGGKYYLIITMEDDINIAVKKIPFEIKRKNEKAPTGIGPTVDEPGEPEIPYDEPYDPDPDIVTIAPGGPTFEDGVGKPIVSYSYIGRDGTTYPEDNNPTTVKPVKPGKYYLIVTISDDVNSYERRFPFTITKGNKEAPKLESNSNPNGIGAYNEIVKDQSNGLIYNLDEKVEYQYSTDNGAHWQNVPKESTSISGLAVGTVLLREKETEEYNASESVSINIGPGVYVEHQTFTWNKILNTVSFGKFFKETQTVYVRNSKEDGTAVSSVEYYISSSQKTTSSLDAVSTWKAYTNLGVKLNPTEEYIVYFKVNDKYGEHTYLSTDGIIVDTDAPIVRGIVSGTVYPTGTNTITFTVEDKYLDRVGYIQTGEPEMGLLGTDTGVLNQKSYVLPAGTYEKIIAIDKAGNRTEIFNVTVAAGQKKPIISGPYKKPNPGGPKGNPVTPTLDGGPYVMYPSDEPTGDPIFEFDYPDDGPEDVTLTEPNPDYEIFLGPEDDDGNPTFGPVNDFPKRIPGGTTIYIRKKQKLPLGPSDFTPYKVPEAAKTMVYLETSPVGAGTVSINGESVNHMRVYTGKNIDIKAEATGDFEFYQWISKETRAVVDTNAEVSYEPEAENGVEYLVAVFRLTGDTIIEIPKETALGGVFTKDFVYDGSLKTAITDANIDENLIKSEQSVTSAVNAGTYTFALKPKDGYMWSDGTTEEKTYVWHIEKAETEAPTLSYSAKDEYITYRGATGTYNRKVSVKKGKDGAEKEYASFVSGKGAINPTGDGEPISGTNPIQYGTYYVKTMGDINHKDSAWVPVIVGLETPRIIPFGPIESLVNPVEVTTHTELSTTDGVKKITVRYRKKGDSAWIVSTRDIPISTQVDVKYPNVGGTLLENTDYEYQTILTMEGGKEDASDDYEYEGPVSAFRTRKSNGQGRGTIVTEIVNESSSTAREVMIAIEKGNAMLSSEMLIAAANSTVESTPVTGLDDGVYNIVLRTRDGYFVQTRSVTIDSGSSQRISFVIKNGEIKSVVEIAPGSPAVAVEGLGELFTGSEISNAENGTLSVEVKLEVEQKTAANAEDHGKLAAKAQEDNNSIALYLDMNLYKISATLDSVTGMELSERTDNIGLSNTKVLEIALPYDTARNSDIVVYRCHDTQAAKLTALSARPASHYADGTYFVGNGYIFVYASGFSTYGISSKYNGNSGGSGGSGNGPEGDIPGSDGPDGKAVKPPKTGEPIPEMPKGSNFVMACLETEDKKKRLLVNPEE